MSRSGAISAAVGVVIVAAVLFLLARQGTPIGTDLSVVGKGRPAVVLAYENFTPAGAEGLDRLRAVRPDYEDRVAFVVADLGTPAGRAFATRHNLQNGMAVFLGPNGEPVRMTGSVSNEQGLRAQLDRVLAGVPWGG
jgi:hypothetical protein